MRGSHAGVADEVRWAGGPRASTQLSAETGDDDKHLSKRDKTFVAAALRFRGGHAFDKE
jgi:hypothetical protein